MKPIILALSLIVASGSPVAAQDASAPRPEIFGVGTFSTGAYELPPTFTTDGRTAYFTISTPAYGRLHMIMETKLQDGKWTTPVLASFSGQHGDADPIISPDGSKLFFLSRRPAPGREATRQDFDIWFVAREGNGWGAPQHIPSASGPMDEHYASATSDGTLYISAVRPDTRGRGDVYRVPFVNGRYGEPESLGPEVNSPDHHDTTPFVAPDESYLIFGSSGRPDGRSPAIDLYVSFRRDGKWTPARNLGPQVNSGRTDYCPIVRDGYLYFASERGFADDPLPSAVSTTQWLAMLTSPGNGLGDTFRIRLSDIEAMRQ